MRALISAGRVCGTPATLNRPRVGARIVVSTRIAVVLPAPFGPSTPTISPAATRRVRSSRATSEP
jgi:hypothetical protein